MQKNLLNIFNKKKKIRKELQNLILLKHPVYKLKNIYFDSPLYIFLSYPIYI